VIVDPGTRSDRDAPRPMVLTAERHARRLSMVDFDIPVEVATRMRLPKSFNARNPQARRDLAASLRHVLAGVHPDGASAREHAHSNGNGSGSGSSRGRDRRLPARIRRSPRCGHGSRPTPVTDAPSATTTARWAERYAKLDRDAAGLRRRIEQRTNTIARHFDRVCEVLEVLGYLEGDIVTPRRRAARPSLR
jgi:ATP-dependent RNA helicase HelY